jgi:hypothetical protein
MKKVRKEREIEIRGRNTERRSCGKIPMLYRDTKRSHQEEKRCCIHQNYVIPAKAETYLLEITIHFLFLWISATSSAKHHLAVYNDAAMQLENAHSPKKS